MDWCACVVWVGWGGQPSGTTPPPNPPTSTHSLPQIALNMRPLEMPLHWGRAKIVRKHKLNYLGPHSQQAKHAESFTAAQMDFLGKKNSAWLMQNLSHLNPFQ